MAVNTASSPFTNLTGKAGATNLVGDDREEDVPQRPHQMAMAELSTKIHPISSGHREWLAEQVRMSRPPPPRLVNTTPRAILSRRRVSATSPEACGERGGDRRRAFDHGEHERGQTGLTLRADRRTRRGDPVADQRQSLLDEEEADRGRTR
jgi:hypothetical protein